MWVGFASDIIIVLILYQNKMPLVNSTSVLKKDLGDVWLLVIGFVIVLGQFFFLPLFFWPASFLVGFLLGVISLMRSIKKKMTGLILTSFLLMVLPIMLVFVYRAIN